MRLPRELCARGALTQSNKMVSTALLDDPAMQLDRRLTEPDGCKREPLACYRPSAGCLMTLSLRPTREASLIPGRGARTRQARPEESGELGVD